MSLGCLGEPFRGCLGARRMPAAASPRTSSAATTQRQRGAASRSRAAAMAEGKSGGAGLFAKQVQKHFSRAQEKVQHDAHPRHPTPKIPSFGVFWDLFPLQQQGAWFYGHRSAPMGAPNVLIWVLLGQRHHCSMTLSLMASPQSPPSCSKWDFFLPKTPSSGYGATGCRWYGLVGGDSPQWDLSQGRSLENRRSPQRK